MLIETKNEKGVVKVRSDATNAYDLCMDVAACIEAEPRRYNQDTWLALRHDEEETLGELTDERQFYLDARYPACGTIGCRAGWMAVLTGTAVAHQFLVKDAATDLLKMDRSEPGPFEWAVERLFEGLALDREMRERDEGRYYSTDWYEPQVGSAEYAKLGAQGLREFAERWKERLLNTPITHGQEI